MKLSTTFPITGCQKLTEVDDEDKPRAFHEKHTATHTGANAPGKEWKGYVVQTVGMTNKGFP